MKSNFRSVFLPLEGGVWGLQDNSGTTYVPTNMPQDLKVPQRRSSCLISVSSDMSSIFQVGELVRIISYKIL